MNNEPGINSKELLIRSQDTPNPLAIKFILNQTLKTEGKATFKTAQEAGRLPLTDSLFNILGVTQVYLFENTATITHSGELSSELLKEQVMAVIRARIQVHDPNFISIEDTGREFSLGNNREHKSLEIQQVEDILDRTIRPGLQADGGDVEIISFENDEIKILYQGACGGCPSALMGTLDAIQSILRYELKNDELIVVPL